MNKITGINVNKGQWLYIEILDDEHVLVELHSVDKTETLKDSLTLKIQHETLGV